MELLTLNYIDVFDRNEIKTISFSSNLLNKNFNKKSLFATLIDGKSMEPLLLDKSILIADLSQKEIKEEGIYIVYKDNKMWVKKAKKINKEQKFISINKEFSHLVFNINEVNIVAKVVLSFTKL